MAKTNKETFPDNPWNKTVSTNTFLLPAELAAVTKAAEFAINSLFTDGLELEPLIEKNVPWLNLTELELATGDGWLEIQLSPQFDKHKIIPPIFGDDLPESLTNQTDIIQSKYALPLYNSMVSLVNEKPDMNSLNKKVDELGDSLE